MANTEKVVKLTKKDFYAALRGMVEGIEMVGEIPAEEVLAFIDKSVAQLDNKAAKAREKAAEKAEKGDKLYEVVVSALTSELQTIDAITATVEGIVAETDMEDMDITKAKVTARLTQAFRNEVARKEQVKAGSRKVMGYALKDAAPAVSEEVEGFYLDEEDSEWVK